MFLNVKPGLINARPNLVSLTTGAVFASLCLQKDGQLGKDGKDEPYPETAPDHSIFELIRIPLYYTLRSFARSLDRRIKWYDAKH